LGRADQLETFMEMRTEQQINTSSSTFLKKQLISDIDTLHRWEELLLDLLPKHN